MSKKIFKRNVTLHEEPEAAANLSFDQLPAAVSEILKEVKGLKDLLTNKPEPPTPPKEPITSITQLANFLHCSRVTAHQLKQSGKFPVMQYGRKFIIDPEQVLLAFEGEYRTK